MDINRSVCRRSNSRYQRTKFLPDPNRISSKTNSAAKIRSQLLERRKQQIIMLCTDITNTIYSRHVIDSSLALKSYGHKVSIVTCGILERKKVQELLPIEVIQVGTWLPINFYGALENFFYFVRSLYSTVWMIYLFQNVQPKVSVVFCETNFLMIPILKRFTNYKIVYFQYNFNLSKYRVPASKIKISNIFYKYAISRADEIIVPNDVFSRIYKRSFYNKMPRAFICQPFLNFKQLRNEKMVPVNHIFESLTLESALFLVLGEYHPHSNFELAIDAFYLLMQSVHHKNHKNLFLIICGHCSRRNEEQIAYYQRLLFRVKKLSLDGHVIFSKRVSRAHKKTLMIHSKGLIDTVPDSLFNRYVLEAMALGKPVISPDSGFTRECLDNGVTGYVIPPTPEHYCVAMTEIAFNSGKAEFIGKMAHCEFVKTYSFEAFSGRLYRMLTQIFVRDKIKKKYAKRQSNNVNTENSTNQLGQREDLIFL